MASQEKVQLGLNSFTGGNLESPFLQEELFVSETELEWKADLARLEAETPFQTAFEQGDTILVDRTEPKEAFGEQEERTGPDDFTMEETKAYDEGAPADLEDSLEEAYDKDEVEYVEGETEEEKALARMKFEFQTKNRIWRNDGRTSSLLGRKYGPNDFLIDKKGVRLESETHGVLEFETEWFRTWPKLSEAIEKAVAMTEDMNKASRSNFDKTRKAFPFNIDHLRKGSAKEKSQGFWEKRKGFEGEKEKILGANEALEVEITDPKWEAGIQSSESFLLDYYESFLRQHEWPFFRDGAIKHAKAILDAANTDGIPITELVKLRSFLQLIVNYIMRGHGGEESKKAGAFADVKGKPAKQAFTLMSRTSFASMYQSLLTEKEKKLFQKIVKTDVILQEMSLNQQSPVFIKGYGTKRYEPGPTVDKWLSGILSGVDLLSARTGNGLSEAMGRYDVETRKGKKDRWLVRFETRNTKMGSWKEARDWVKYTSELFDLASKRERDAASLAFQQGITDENKLTNLVFHARHPELRGRLIRKDERDLAQNWRRILNDVVRPVLAVRPERKEFEGAEDRFGQSSFYSDMEEYSADDEAADADQDLETQTDEDDLSSEQIAGPEDEIGLSGEEMDHSLEARELDPLLVDLAEKTIARETPLLEYEKFSRWTECFSAKDIAKVKKVYEDNASAANSNSLDRCNCIVMLNVALGQLLTLTLKSNRARGTSTRIVHMADLTTRSIEKAMQQLIRRGYALAPIIMNFFDRRNQTAGTLKPERLKASVQAKVLALAKTQGCWFAFGLSMMDGYHSVLLLVDGTGADAKIYWLDQFSGGVTDDVTTGLDQRITDKTQAWWQAVMDAKRKGYNTTIRIWRLRKRRNTQ